MSAAIEDFLSELDREVREQTKARYGEETGAVQEIAGLILDLRQLPGYLEDELGWDFAKQFLKYLNRLIGHLDKRPGYETDSPLLCTNARSLKRIASILADPFGWIAHDLLEYGLFPLIQEISRHDGNMWVSDEAVQDATWEYFREKFGRIGRKGEDEPSDEDVDKALGEGE